MAPFSVIKANRKSSDSINYLISLFIFFRLPLGIPIYIGRKKIRNLEDSETRISLPSIHISRNHCHITVNSDGKAILTDTSSNGTYVNSNLVNNGDLEIFADDEISLGTNTADRPLEADIVVFRFEVCGSSITVKSEPTPSDGSERSLVIDTASEGDIKSEIIPKSEMNGEDNIDEIQVAEDEEFMLSQQYYQSIKEEADAEIDYASNLDFFRENEIIELPDSDEEEELIRMREENIQQIPELDISNEEQIPALDLKYLNQFSQMPINEAPEANGPYN